MLHSMYMYIYYHTPFEDPTQNFTCWIPDDRELEKHNGGRTSSSKMFK